MKSKRVYLVLMWLSHDPKHPYHVSTYQIFPYRSEEKAWQHGEFSECDYYAVGDSHPFEGRWK